MATVVGDLVVYLRANTLQFDKGMARASATLTKTGKTMGRVGSVMTTKLSLPMALIGGVAIKMAMDFETSMQQIVGLVGVAQEQVDEWRESIIRLGPSLGKTSTELGKAMFFITSAGLRGSTALNALEASAKGAAAGLGETESVADAATSAMNAYGEANLSAEQAVSVLVATVREGKAEAASLAPVLGRIIPIAAELGVEFHEVGGAMAVMTRLGLNANESATALRSTLATILKPTKQAELEMSKYGMSMGELKTILREQGLIALLTKLKDTFGDNEESMQKVFRNVRALNGVLSIVGKNVENNVKIFKSLADTTTDDLDKAFAVASKTAKFKLNAALADLQNTFIELGEVVMPTVVPLFEQLGTAMKNITGFLNKLNPVQRTMLTNVLLMSVALGPLAWAFSKVSLAAGAATGAVVKWNAAMATSTVATGAAIASVAEYTAFMSSATVATTAATTAATGAATGFGVFATTITLGAAAASTFVIALGAIALALGAVIGTGLRPYVNEFMRFIGIMDSVGAHLQSDIIDGMLKTNETFDNSVHTLNKLKEQLGLTGEKWDFVNKKTRTNAERIVHLTDLALRLAKVQREAAGEAEKVQTAEERANDVKKRALEQMPALIDKSSKAEEVRLNLLKEELELYTKGDIEKALEGMVSQNEDMKTLAIDRNQRADEFSDDMLTWLTMAKENNVALPEGMREMAKELKGKVNPAVNKLVDNWKVFNTDARATGKILDTIWLSSGDRAKAALQGGFREGIKLGVQEGGVAMDAFVKRIQDTTIYVRITPDIDSLADFNQAVQDAMSGRSPATGG
jgi:TP901 family phage tail tape measure protein